MKIIRLLILTATLLALSLHDLMAMETTQKLELLEDEGLVAPDRFIYCIHILNDLRREIKYMDDQVKSGHIQIFLNNVYDRLEGSYDPPTNQRSFVQFMQDLSTDLSTKLDVEFTKEIRDPFKVYKKTILNAVEKKIEDTKNALAMEEQYVQVKQKAIICSSKTKEMLERNRRKLDFIKRYADYYVLSLQKTNGKVLSSPVDKAIHDLQRRLLSLEERSKNVRKLRSFDKHADIAIQCLHSGFNPKFTLFVVNSFLNSTRNSYGHFSANNFALDFIRIERCDLAKTEQKLLERIAAIQSAAQTPEISCWKERTNSYPVSYTPTEEERALLINQSLAFFLVQSTDVNEVYTGNLRKNIYFNVERPGEKSALTRLRQLSACREKLQQAQDEAKDYGKKDSAATASQMGNIVLRPTYITKQYHKFVKALIGNKSVPPFVRNLWGMPPVIILDVGAATGANSLELVKMGATVVANDLWTALPDLADFRSRFTTEERKRVLFNTQEFPDKVEYPDNTFETILISHVPQYLTGPQLRYGFKKSYTWVKPGGKLFVQALTPYSNPFCWRPKTTTNLLRLKVEWPGWFRQAKKQVAYELGTQCDEKYHHFYRSSAMPSFGHAIHPEILERELRGAGFKIESITYADLHQAFISPLTYREHEFYVMGECEDEEEREAYERKRARIVKKLTHFYGYKAQLDKDRKSFLEYKRLQSKEKSMQEEIQICKDVINSLCRETDDAKALGMLKDTLEQIDFDSSVNEDFSPEKLMIDLTERMLKDLGSYFFNYILTAEIHRPLNLYYRLSGSTNCLPTMASVHAIVKKPREISMTKFTITKSRRALAS